MEAGVNSIYVLLFVLKYIVLKYIFSPGGPGIVRNRVLISHSCGVSLKASLSQ